MLRNKAFSMALIFLVIAALISACGKSKEEAAVPVVAKYKDGQVTQKDFDKFKGVVSIFNPSYGQMIDQPEVQESLLKQLIAYRVLNDRADKPSKETGETKAKEQMKEIEAYFGSAAAQGQTFDELLKSKNVTKEDLEDFLKLDITTRTYMSTQVTEDEMKKEYDRNLESDKNYYDKASVRHILIAFKNNETGKEITKEEALKKAKDVQKKLNEGGDFAALAKELSEDPGSKENGGLYPDAQVSQWVPEFKKAALELPLNKVSDPVETSYGYHVMKVEKRTEGKYEDVKQQLRDNLAGGKMTEFMDKELPGLITETNLPKKEEAKTETDGATNGTEKDKADTGAKTDNPTKDTAETK
ncbi:hypothetical protein SY83_06490 [Paenibacillus swuensis]|uniref:PpiC domain-containing protein n=1 Tax=Paenibacillus swuensis TaxID=1178515 RepID=A0A172TG08_9BACL|nr:peptidylprolyl isomerase [Paenibacillus swuensis]ANE45989.1 hypothetical protein SY83_06490 [Paenibacillus swuensis]